MKSGNRSILAFGFLLTLLSVASAVETIEANVEQNCGAMLGGIGTGYIELWPDGCFHDWSIFNRGHWGYRQDFWNVDKADRLPLAEMNQDAMQFYVWTRAQGAPANGAIARRLSLNGPQLNPYSYNTWLQNMEGITFDGTFPGAVLHYKDPTLPVQVTGRFFSPVIPHELKISATPGFYAVFTLRNTSDLVQEVSLASYLRNPLAEGGDGPSRSPAARKLHTSVTTDGGTTYLTMRTDAQGPVQTTLGNLSLSMTGGTPSWIAMDFGEFLLGRTVQLQPWNQRYETALRGLRFTGKLPNSSEQPCPMTLGSLAVKGSEIPNLTEQPKAMATTSKEDLAKLSNEEIGLIIAQARRIPSLNSIVTQAEAVDPTLLDPTKKGRELVDLLCQLVGQYAGADGRAATWGDGMLASSVTLQPGEEKEIRVVLSWYFPNHPSPDKSRNMGHIYTSWFKDAEEVNRYLTTNYDAFRQRVDTFQQTFRESTLPPDLLLSIAGQLNTLVCSSWWTEDGKMGVWEGLGCCGLNSATVLEQGSHPIAALFPEYEKNWTHMATTYQSDTTGRLYILLPSDLDKGSKNQGYGYVDRNCQFVWMICRDYLWYGGKDYLDSYYPSVVKALKVFEGMDSDGDGLPDKHTESNTYDTWPLHGTPSYFASIWIGALRCGIRMAHDAGDTANERKWQGILDKALASFNAKLWNGEYYSLLIDGSQRDEACMTDQISGEFFTGLMGLGNALPPDRIHQVLGAIYKYNFTPDQGLYNGFYPPGRQPQMPTYENVQAEGNWAGIEYDMAAFFYDQGMPEQGENVVKAVMQRYLRAGRFFNYEECGPHYSRDLSVWAVLLGATGYKIDVPNSTLTIASPIHGDLKAPWVSATGLGEFTKTAAGFDLECRDGEMSFSTLRVNVPGLKAATVDGKDVACTVNEKEGLTTLAFSQPLTLKTGDRLVLK